MRTTLGVLLTLWGAFFLVFSRRVARGQHTPGRSRADEGLDDGIGPHRATTAFNAVLGTALTVVGALIAAGAL